MSSIGSGEIVATTPQPAVEKEALAGSGAQCSTYTFPEGKVLERALRGHTRSASHGGNDGTSTIMSRPSALKTGRGHQRALSHGQISEAGTALRPGHSRVGSKTDFILPPGHKEETLSGSASRGSAKGHSRQASRSESIYTLRRTAPPSLWRRMICTALGRAPHADVEERKRIVVPNHMVPPKTPRKEHPNGQRVNNRVRTTKYTLLSFLPRNLLEQFHRIANLYFIFIVLLNWVPAINAFGKEISMIPVIFVLGVTAVKDLFEDRRRHASDKRINNSTCRIYHSDEDRYKKVLWKDVRVGDLIHLSNNELVPADILLLRSSDPNGLCYIDTSHLDGETNLKQRQVTRGFVDKQKRFEPSKFKSKIEVDPPTTKIYKFHGTMIHPMNDARVPVSTENLLLRECLLKNTDFIEGIVIYAGHETKAMLNNGGPRYKRSKLERQMNLDVICCVLILVLLCVIGAIGCKLWLDAYENLPEPFVVKDYINSDALLTFWTFIIILQIMIPLSLYVTLEMCKLLQVYHIHHNVDLYDSLTDKRIECRALNITEELGQIQYIFSDKTGTLTENKMIFRRCSIAGVEYNHPHLQNEIKSKSGGSLSVLINPKMQEDLSQIAVLNESGFGFRQMHAARIQEFLILLAICNTVVVTRHPHYDMMNASGAIDDSISSVFERPKKTKTTDPDVVPSASASTRANLAATDRYSRLTESRSVTPSPPLHEHSQLSDISCNSHVPSFPVQPTEPIPSTNEPDDELEAVIKVTRPKILNISSILFSGRKNGSTTNLTDEQKVKMKRSHTPSPCELQPIFEAESPDELALVGAANLYNCRLQSRTPNLVSVSLPVEEVIDYELLNVLPFDSVRKCMSVVVKHPYTKEITVYCKGADSSVLAKLAPVESDPEMKQIISTTQQQLNVYARHGLRVLVMAKRTISQVEYAEWLRKHKETELCCENYERRMRDSFASLEKNLTLLGATGIEDRLQDGVPDTILSLIDAGIIVWVLTGDKPETAINIAYSAKLFSPDMELLKLMARTKEAAEDTIKCYLDEIDRQCATSNTTPDIQSSSTSSVSQVVPRIPKKAQKRALVVDGKTLTFILDKRSNLTKPFLRLTKFCNSVLCCRATPLQKAYIVRVVKEELKVRTLAIGDGANDVSMIQTADVGIGISGQEGMQAVMAADFALSRFKYLKRFLLVHGHWSYDRLSRMVLYFFYKNAAFVFLVFWYQLFCGFSGAVMIDQMYLMLYNLFFTSLPPLAIGVYDQVATEELLLSKPELYRQGRLGKVYRPYSFWLTMADALYQSIAIFFLVQATYADSTLDFWAFGTTLTTACMFVMLCHVAMETRSWTLLHIGAILFSVGSFYVFSLIYNSLCVNCLGLPSTYGVIQDCLKSPVYWLVSILSCVVALLPRLVMKVIKNMFFPDDVTRAILAHRRNACRGEGFLVSWSRSSSASSIFRATDQRNTNNILTTIT